MSNYKSVEGKYTNAKIFADIIEDGVFTQVQALCDHPAFEDAKIRLMPDCHVGAACTIGTTVCLNKKVVIPNIVGVDIGCGVMTTIFTSKNPINFKELDNFINESIPNGEHIRNEVHPNINANVVKEIKEINKELSLSNEDYFINSCGSLGGGNHYIEVGKIDETTYALSVHTGSRNLGKRVCEYFQRKAMENIAKNENYKDEIDELIAKYRAENKEQEIGKAIKELKEIHKANNFGLPKDMQYVENETFDAYIRNMIKCQNMAKENRTLISKDIMKYLIEMPNNHDIRIKEVFDTIHNYIEVEDTTKSYYIRKGAISAKKDEKVAIPLNMKDGVIIGIGKGNADWNYSAPHGAGRLLSRSKAKENVSLEEFADAMKDVQSWSVCDETIDESPQAYKPAASIIEYIKDTVDIVAIIKPIYNFKAHTKSKSWKEIKAEEKARKNNK